jgi:hypothetical protein
MGTSVEIFMLPIGRSPHCVFGFGGALLLVSLAMAGCTSDSGVGKTYPVSGKVTLDDEPVTAERTTILFKPDASRGNTSPFEPTGTVDDQGVYTLSTNGQEGAPPGWYKVIVTAVSEPPQHPKAPDKRTNRPIALSLLPARYGQAHTSNLAIEVVERPPSGAYDLKLTRK